jgi:uncharacterized protein YggU (UPF0235/DUF167 family)
MARVAVKLTPGASIERIDGWGADGSGQPVLNVRVRARPVEGRANAALILLLAKVLDVPRSTLTLMRGGQSRLKMIEVEGMADADLRARLTGM